MEDQQKLDIARRLERVAEVFFDGNKSELARAINMTPRALNSYLKGDRAPGAGILMKLQDQGVSIDWLLTGDGEIYQHGMTELWLDQFTQDAPSWYELLFFIEIACREKYHNSLMYEFFELKDQDDDYANILLAVRDQLYTSALEKNNIPSLIGFGAHKLGLTPDEYVSRLKQGQKLLGKKEPPKELLKWGKNGARHEGAIHLLELLRHINLFKNN